jgi:steroid 5-alpha reductase family enzyme
MTDTGLSGSLLLIGALILAYMTVWFILAMARKDNSLADVAWGLGFVLIAGLTSLSSPAWPVRKALANALVLAWGLRLFIYISLRKRKKGEDFRYAEWRRKWGRLFALRCYLQVFLLQGLFMLVISLPVVIINADTRGAPVNGLDILGAGLWLLGFIFESVSDAQLHRFKKDPANRGRVMTSGLWRYSRHPNYFGESLIWWGLSLVALSATSGPLAALSPALLTFLLLKVSGVPLLERRYAGNPEFEAYAGRTSVFVPWFPNKSKAR